MYKSIRKALEIVKADQPETCITEHLIRRLCAEKKVKTIKSGSKTLVNIQSLREYLANGEQ